ncbi:poly [ADP-ribose] polymerase tankyrase-1-like [Liolophura sinensis]|uniref:poly [ADP-ribose] polymerase tankyrase-1-like n=1 Tax=Liolophura sinensis TaxID=3198878 RepID=UPI0031597E38
MDTMSWVETAKKLSEAIKSRDFGCVRHLLDHISDYDHIQHIEACFEGTDPVNLAIDHKDETIACYLVEKCFCTDNIYQWPESKANIWSSHDDGSGKCPWEYDASDNAADKHLVKVKLLIDSIRSGRRRPGESLVSPTPVIRVKERARNSSKGKPMTVLYSTEWSEADQARDIVTKLGSNIATKNNNTLLHGCADKSSSHVYVYANNGVPVNVQNKDGDTALHIAVRKGCHLVAESLLQCGADLSVRNKLGQTPLDEADGHMKALLEMFEPGLVTAVCKGNTRMVTKLMIRLWCSVNCIVKENKTIIELAESRRNNPPAVSDCLRILQENSKTSELIHGVLSEDLLTTKKILMTQKGWSINSRFGGPYGKTLLSCAIDRNNLQLVQLLLKHGAKVGQMRVQEAPGSSRTEPLFQRCIRRQCPINIARLMFSALSPEERDEKDMDGNTPILRAVQEGMSPNWIQWILRENYGYNVTDRNMDGLTPRELAACLGHEDIVQAIDKFIVHQLGKLLLFHLPVTFYGEGNTNVTDTETGQPLLDLARVNKNTDADFKVLKRYKNIEARGLALFQAAAAGNMEDVKNLNDADYKDKNGYTALTRAMVFNQVEVGRQLCIDRPVLRTIPDNCNRYPLHYAYALPEDQGQPFVRLLLEKNPDDLERRQDKDGRIPAEYRNIRDSEEITQMLFDARTLNAYRERVPLDSKQVGDVAKTTEDAKSLLRLTKDNTI